MRALYNHPDQSIILHGQYCTWHQGQDLHSRSKIIPRTCTHSLGERGKQGKVQVTGVVSCLAR